MSGKTSHVAVIGAGVVGLQAAISLLKAGFTVTIIAKHFPGDLSIEYTSPWAGGQWRPHSGPNDHEVQQWDRLSYEHWRKLAKDPNETGIGAYDSVEYFYNEDLPWYIDFVDNFQRLDSKYCPRGSRVAIKYSSFTFSAPTYLKYLLKQFHSLGGTSIIFKLSHNEFSRALAAAQGYLTEKGLAKVDVFVNASGLGALNLVPDPNMFPVRGQTVLVKGVAKQITTFHYQGDPKTGDEVVMYVLPRGSDGTTVIGGTKQAGNWDENVDEELAEFMLSRARPFATELLNVQGEYDVIKSQVGLRPGRKGGVRMELELVGDVHVCHAYGNAGAGYPNSIGSAAQIVKLVQQALHLEQFRRRHHHVLHRRLDRTRRRPNSSDQAGRITDGNPPLRHILRDHAAGPNNRAIPDRHARQHRHIARDPDIVAHDNGRAQLGALSAVAQERVLGVRGREKGHVGPDERARPNRHRARVQDRAVCVDEGAGTDRCVRPVVDEERRRDPGLGGELGFIVGFGGCARW